MKKRTLTGLAVAGVLALALSGCGRTIPETGSQKESDYIEACSEAGGTFIPGNETPGTSFRSLCAFRYPALPTAE